jgi:hypothetical protein
LRGGVAQNLADKNAGLGRQTKVIKVLKVCDIVK